MGNYLMEFTISLATLDDVQLLTEHRIRMWIALRPELNTQANQMATLTREWINKMFSEGRLRGFIAKTESGEIAGSGCVWIREEPPRFVGSRLLGPYLMSMFTEEPFRRKGVATLIAKKAIEWCKQQGYPVISLHASEAGAAVYERLGFERSPEMRLWL